MCRLRRDQSQSGHPTRPGSMAASASASGPALTNWGPNILKLASYKPHRQRAGDDVVGLRDGVMDEMGTQMEMWMDGWLAGWLAVDADASCRCQMRQDTLNCMTIPHQETGFGLKGGTVGAQSIS